MNVELVAHGAGLSLFTKQDTKLAEELARLKTSYGVSYTACSNTMKAQGLTRADLIDQVDRAMPAMVRLMDYRSRDGRTSSRSEELMADSWNWEGAWM